MPIYEYTCRSCGCQFEVLHRSSRETKPACPKCGADEVDKLFSVFGFSSGGSFVSSSTKGAGCSACSSRNCSSCG